MRILFVPMVGGRGIGPITRCLAVAEEASRRGHDVTFLCKKGFVPWVNNKYKCFLATEPVRPNISSQSPLIKWSDIAVVLGLTEEEFVARSIENELTILNDWKPNFIFTEYNLTIPISAQITGTPFAATVSWPDYANFQSPLSTNTNRVFPNSESTHNKFLAKYSLETISDLGDLACLQSNLKIAPTIPELSPELINLPSVLFVGELLYRSLEEANLPHWFGDLDRKKTIYVYLSSADIPFEKSLLAIERAFSNTHYSVIVVTGSNNLDAQAVSVGRNIYMNERWPGLSVLKRSSISICPGTPNTISAALLSGIPTISIPGTDSERYYHSINLSNQGAGIVLSVEDFLQADHLRTTVELLMSSQEWNENAARLGGKIKNCGGPTEAMNVIERMLH